MLSILKTVRNCIVIILLTLVIVTPVRAQTSAPFTDPFKLVNAFLGLFLTNSPPEFIKGSVPASVAQDPDKLLKLTPFPTTAIPAKPNFVYFCQGNTAWQNVCHMGGGGCGPTSLAMVFNSFGTVMSPPQVDAIFRSSGWRGTRNSCDDSGSRMTTALKSSWLRDTMGYEVSEANIAYNNILNLNQAKTFLDKGYLIIGSSDNFPCVKSSIYPCGHIFVVDNVDIATANVSIRDPNNCSYTDGNDEIEANRIRGVSSFPWLYAYAIKRVPLVTPAP